MLPKNSINSQVAGNVNSANAMNAANRAFRKSPIVSSFSCSPADDGTRRNFTHAASSVRVGLRAEQRIDLGLGGFDPYPGLDGPSQDDLALTVEVLEAVGRI